MLSLIIHCVLGIPCWNVLSIEFGVCTQSEIHHSYNPRINLRIHLMIQCHKMQPHHSCPQGKYWYCFQAAIAGITTRATIIDQHFCTMPHTRVSVEVTHQAFKCFTCSTCSTCLNHYNSSQHPMWRCSRSSECLDAFTEGLEVAPSIVENAYLNCGYWICLDRIQHHFRHDLWWVLNYNSHIQTL